MVMGVGLVKLLQEAEMEQLHFGILDKKHQLLHWNPWTHRSSQTAGVLLSVMPIQHKTE